VDKVVYAFLAAPDEEATMRRNDEADSALNRGARKRLGELIAAAEAKVGRPLSEEERAGVRAIRSGLRLEAYSLVFPQESTPAGQVAAHPALHRQRTQNRRMLVIFDEIHHAGDALSWGDAVKEAFDPARRRLALTGTPFRSDANPIPFVTYVDEPGGGKRSSSDYVYGYGPALEDTVVRPVIFLAYSGEMRWRTRAGDEITATLGTPMTKDQIAQAWRTALDPSGEWISRVLEAADKRLTEVRRAMPDAGGLVIAGDHETASAYAGLLRKVSGERPRGPA